MHCFICNELPELDGAQQGALPFTLLALAVVGAGSPAALDLFKFELDVPVAAVEIIGDRRALCLQAETGGQLIGRRICT